MMQNKQKYISLSIIVLAIAAGVFFMTRTKVDGPAPHSGNELVVAVKPETAVIDQNAVTSTEKKDNPGVVSKSAKLTKEQHDLLARLQKTVKARDYASYADVLIDVYKKNWAGVDEFKKLESELYVYATDTYWVKGDLSNSLRVSTIVYAKIPEAWRFRYLRIVTLEKYGRNALNAGDLSTAEKYAMQILQMLFRPEGANLLADVYIKKIESAILVKDKGAADAALGYIWDYEVSQDRRDKLMTLKEKVSRL